MDKTNAGRAIKLPTHENSLKVIKIFSNDIDS